MEKKGKKRSWYYQKNVVLFFVLKHLFHVFLGFPRSWLFFPTPPFFFFFFLSFFFSPFFKIFFFSHLFVFHKIDVWIVNWLPMTITQLSSHSFITSRMLLILLRIYRIFLSLFHLVFVFLVQILAMCLFPRLLHRFFFSLFGLL